MMIESTKPVILKTINKKSFLGEGGGREGEGHDVVETSIGPFCDNEHFSFVFPTEHILFQYFHLVKMNFLIKSAILEAQD